MLHERAGASSAAGDGVGARSGDDARTADGCAERYARQLLADCCASVRVALPRGGDLHSAFEWARSGAMALTGEEQGPPRLATGPLASCARGVALALAALAPGTELTHLDGPALLGERAAIAGLQRRGAISPGGGCRLLRADDGWLALQLARREDEELLPAWLEAEPTTPAETAWDFASRLVRERALCELVARGRLLGLALAAVVEPPHAAPPWCRVRATGPRASRIAGSSPLVIDLSALWAGPLCGQLLALAGARVVKLETPRRPDGARGGPAGFYDLMNGGKRSVALDWSESAGRRALAGLLDVADVVIESARPRALAQLGIVAEEIVHRRPGLTWISITGYGRGRPEADWVAFGDDAGVAAGLSGAWARRADGPVFCGDAIADPLTGLHAALAAWTAWQSGEARLLDLSLRDVTAHALRWPTHAEAKASVADDSVWVGDREEPVAPPRARAARAPARPLGADTAATLHELGVAT